MILHKIDYNGGEIWVDKSEIKVGDFITDKYKVWKWLDTESLLGRFKVVAQSITNPSYIDGVPFVEVGLVSSWDKERQIDFSKMMFDLDEKGKVESSSHYAQIIYNRGYNLAAQAKQFTEADIVRVGRHLVDMMLHKRSFLVEAEVKEYIQMFIQPKVVNIEIEMTKEARFEKNPDFHGTGYTNPGGFFDVLKTYQKDGKTFLTVKQVNYE